LTARTSIAAAGNVEPAALASLRSLGYAVTVANGGRLYKAESAECKFVAEDLLLLLGLVKLHEMRGSGWASTDAEVQDFLTFDVEHPPTQGDRLDVWADQGSVQVICVTAFGDPVDLGVDEARDFSERLY
jgi:hypothetical protein